MKNSCGLVCQRGMYSNPKVTHEISLCIKSLVENENVTEFWVGLKGGFSGICQRIVNELKEKNPKIHINVIVPRHMKNDETLAGILNDYDNILFLRDCDSVDNDECVVLCNEYIAKNSDYLISYADKNYTEKEYPDIRKIFMFDE